MSEDTARDAAHRLGRITSDGTLVILQSDVMRMLEDGVAPCPMCGASAVGFIDENGERVGQVSALPPVSSRCSNCGWERP